ncbi:ATP-binding response regulator [Robertkochia sediminum]|uniref:ATP-binding response regulator n=1 Tax=Robertkochia sediminum TaxID=2785326 RepID=UPI00193130E0|nr:ATP-binding protein [Robertkochia sediminum]MBL7473931.1 response regulator [Robertkochia sediminum]
MARLKKVITAKVLISYLVLLLLAIVAGWIIYAELNSFTRAQENNTQENNKVFGIGRLLTQMYESESFARSAIQSSKESTYRAYLQKTDSIRITLDSLRTITTNANQQALLDSIGILLEQKVTNIRELRQIRNNNASEIALDRAIEKFSNIEETLGRLSLEDFVANPDALGTRRRDLLQEQINILNNYIPRDSTNTVDERTLDSLVIASRAMLEQIQKETARQRLSVAIKENTLLQNDLNTSQQLRQILSVLEKELLENARETNAERKRILNRSINVLSWAAVIGVVLAILFSLVILNDFLQSQRYREQLEEANEYTQTLLKGREQLISMVSHDLRTPLNTILGYTELLAGNTQTQKEAYYAGRIRTASNYVTKLVDDLLDYTKLEAGKVTIDPVPFQLPKLIKETAESVRTIYSNKPITLTYDFPEKLPGKLISDPHRVRQILNNLIGNAYKFTESGTITLSLNHDAASDLVTIGVQDSGIGIPKEKQADIFREFIQAEAGHEKKFGGSGLGLFISRKLAGLLEGDLKMTSEEGIGSSFTLELPARFSKLPSKPSEVSQKPAGDLSGKIVVIIDDDTLLLQMLEDWLRTTNAGVHPFKSATEALSKIPEIDYDLIITDIQLPGINGFRFLELLRTDPAYRYKDQPVIAVSGRKDLDAQKYLKNGFTAFLFKPYNPSDLLEVIRNLETTGNAESKPPIAAPTEKTTTSPALFVLDDLMGFMDHDKIAVRKLLDDLVITTEDDLIRMKALAEAKDRKAISDLAHRMRTMFHQIHAKHMVSALDTLEHQPPEVISELEKQIEQLETAFHDLKRSLETFH